MQARSELICKSTRVSAEPGVISESMKLVLTTRNDLQRV